MKTYTFKNRKEFLNQLDVCFVSLLYIHVPLQF